LVVCSANPAGKANERDGSFGAWRPAAIWGLNNLETPQDALEFSVAASALKHTIYGDFNRVSKEDVLALMGGDASGRVQR
jgi:2-dehydro-3-deoxygluconokinase